MTAELLGKEVPAFETSEELAPGLQGSATGFASGQAAYEEWKFELAQELGVPLVRGYNGHLTSREAGQLGGHIGGQMVRRMIRFAQEQMAQGRQI
ncbi:MAG: alpha/beta-type small acid-soluble spore protein [Bacillota bacterium]|nr:alpha/beta-type small acid-soluble spore protein [Bacillota bacterium]